MEVGKNEICNEAENSSKGLVSIAVVSPKAGNSGRTSVLQK